MFQFPSASPEEAGIPSNCIQNMTRRLARQEVPMHSILLMRKDLLAANLYYYPCTEHSLHRMFSISKSVTSIAIGMLLRDDMLSLDDPIIQYFSEKVPAQVHPWIREMRIRDMLMMRTCHTGTTYKRHIDQDWVESFFTTEPSHPAGTIFRYDTSSAHTLAALVEKLAGMELWSYVRQKLEPLELSSDSYILKDPFGVSMGGSGLVATSMDLMKLGYFLYHKGALNGKQIVGAEYIELATSNLSQTCVGAAIPDEAAGYGFMIWRNRQGGYTCYGMCGQLIIVLPEYDLICVTTADTQSRGGGTQLIYDALFEEIIPFLPPLRENQTQGNTATVPLTDLHLTLPVVKGASSSPLISQVQSKQFQIVKGIAGYEIISLIFENQEGQFRFRYCGAEHCIHFGMGHICTDRLPLYDFFCASSAAWLPDNTLLLRIHVIDECVGSIEMQFSFQGEILTVFMKRHEQTLLNEFDGFLIGHAEK